MIRKKKFAGFLLWIMKEADYLSKRHQEGWEYLMDFNGYCYFRKPMAMMQQKEEIFAV